MPARKKKIALRPIDPFALLQGAEAPISQSAQSAQVIAEAVAAAPGDITVRLAAYRFCFYTHDYAAACDHAQAILRHAARQLNIAQDWRSVMPPDAAFSEHRFAPGLYLQALVGWGYCLARLGELSKAQDVLAKAAALDPMDGFGGAWLLDKIVNAGAEDDAADRA